MAELLGGDAWCDKVEVLMADRRDFRQPGRQDDPWALSTDAANAVLADLRSGQEIANEVSSGSRPIEDLRAWLARIRPGPTGFIFHTLDRIKEGSDVPVRGSGKRGKKRTPSPELLPAPDAFPLSHTGGVPSMTEAAFLAEPGRILLSQLTSPSRFQHGPRPPEPKTSQELARRTAFQAEYALAVLAASGYPTPLRKGRPNANVEDTALVIRLAYAWRQAHSKWPTRQIDPLSGRDISPFMDLVEECLKPFRPIHPTSRDLEEIVRKVLDRLPRS